MLRGFNSSVSLLKGTLAAILTISVFLGKSADNSSAASARKRPAIATNAALESLSFQDELLRLAQECEKHGDYDSSQRLYWKIIETDTGQSNRLKAIAGLKRAMLETINSSEVAVAQLLELAKNYEELGRYKDAEAVYAKLLDTATRGRTNVLALAKQTAKTNLDFMEKSASIQLSLAQAFETKKQFGDAQAAYFKALEITRDPHVEKLALDGFRRVLGSKVSRWTDFAQAVKTGCATFIAGLVPLFAVLLLASPFVLRRACAKRKGQLRIISPLSTQGHILSVGQCQRQTRKSRNEKR